MLSSFFIRKVTPALRLALAMVISFPVFSAQATLAAEVEPGATLGLTSSSKSLREPRLSKEATEKLSLQLKPECDRHFPGLIQAEVRTACSSAAEFFGRYGKTLSEANCRLEYGEDPRLTMACLIGATVSDDLQAKREDFKKNLQLCAEYYPKHTEIDAFFQESCLIGVYLPRVLRPGDKPRLETCSQITPERSFLGPCAVGLSLAQETQNTKLVGDSKPQPVPSAPSQQNEMCEKYFDHVKFHTTYRACLNARSAALEWTGRYADVIKNCSAVVSDGNSDNEKAACLVGASIYRHLSNKEDITQKFQKCGDNKVSYQDRDFLACLTAASLLDFTDRQSAQSGCRDIFKNPRTRSRNDCANSLALF